MENGATCSACNHVHNKADGTCECGCMQKAEMKQEGGTGGTM